MTDTTFSDLMREGEFVREKKAQLDEAIRIFQRALNLASTQTQRGHAMRQIGLCYEHKRHYETALDLYQSALEIAAADQNIADQARCHRHIASVLLKRGNRERALQSAMQAYQLMSGLNDPPTDLVWITHGVVKSLIDSRKPTREVRHWTKIEWEDLQKSWNNESNKTRKNVWLTGFLMDAAYAWAPFSWLLAPIALAIAVWSGLGIRIRQFATGKR